MIAVKTYYIVFAALLALTLATTGAAFVDLGARLNTIVGFTIAIVKALLVAVYFMHLRHSQRLTLLFAGAGVLWLALLMTFVFADYLTRGW
jgi:cytochrome c oxidase subunit 4